jgi:hypothetical protein
MLSTIGPIVRLQVQRGALKVGEKGSRRYHTEPIIAVERLRVTPDGAVGLAADGDILDAHHRDHPLHKNDDGVHGLSIGFTAHYALIQQRFGAHVSVGTAGENLIVETDRRLTLDAVQRGLIVLDASGGEKGRLTQIEIAHPCKAFTGFALRHELVPPDAFKKSLQFLDGGLRGFYCTWAGKPTVLETGDVVAMADDQ